MKTAQKRQIVLFRHQSLIDNGQEYNSQKRQTGLFKAAIFVVLLSIYSSAYSPAGAEESVDLSAARGLIESGRISEASMLLQKEVDKHPENGEAHFLLGRAYLLAGNEVKASALFVKAASIDKGYMEKLAVEYYEAGRILIKDARKSNVGLHYLNKYLSDKPDKGLEIALLLYQDGLDMTGSNKFMAHVILERAMELNPAYEKDEGFYLAYSVRSAKKPSDVVRGGEDFLARFPTSSHVPEVLYVIGEAHFDRRKPQQGRQYFNRLTSEFPDTEWGAKAAGKFR